MLDLKSDSPTVIQGNASDKPDLTIIVNDDVFASLYDGKSNAQQAFMKGMKEVWVLQSHDPHVCIDWLIDWW